jgi:site-specific recombinase XerC
MKPQTQEKFDPVENWLGTVAYSKSNSSHTERNYRMHFNRFLTFIGKTAATIKTEYTQSTDRAFKRKYAELIKAWIVALNRKGLTSSSINVMVAAVQSFFKYNDLTLGFIPTAQSRVTYHNRDITKEELELIFKTSLIRDRAYYAVMAQSGLRPHTISQLKLKHLEQNRLFEGESPVKIEVPQEIAKGKYHKYFSFIGQEAADYLKAYLSTRKNLTSDSYVFVKMGTEEPIDPKRISSQFNKTLKKLKAKDLIDYDERAKGKPAELRLYSLRKWFKKKASQAGAEYVKFWMGHSLGVEEHYISRDPEHHRPIYAEKAAPFLRIELATPTETEKIIAQQAEEIEKLKTQLKRHLDVEQELSQLKSVTEKLLKRVERMEKEKS